jgi:hypothetical protein
MAGRDNLMANYLGYHEIKLNTVQTRAKPPNVTQTEIVMPQTYVTAADIEMRIMGLAPTWPAVEITLRETRDPMEVFGYVPGVYPSPFDVDLLAAKYGPTGVEYQGTLLQPVPADVKSGVKYGGDGTEFTGTLAGGSGLAPGTLLLDTLTGEQYIYITNRLIIKV